MSTMMNGSDVVNAFRSADKRWRSDPEAIVRAADQGMQPAVQLVCC